MMPSYASFKVGKVDRLRFQKDGCDQFYATWQFMKEISRKRENRPSM